MSVSPPSDPRSAAARQPETPEAAEIVARLVSVCPECGTDVERAGYLCDACEDDANADDDDDLDLCCWSCGDEDCDGYCEDDDE